MPDRDFPTQPATPGNGAALPEQQSTFPSLDPGDRIGPYRLQQRLGEGGMGVVWLAEQHEPIRRRVALKIIKQGMDTRQVVARFETERQVLARLDHSNIARVYDAGATDLGRPFFVMEYVPGIPITDYCDMHKLSTAERVGLFLQVCEGVQHAHRNAIIHRDLKPHNVLVAVQEDRPVPKIIDFGVAKATDQRLTDQAAFTDNSVLFYQCGRMNKRRHFKACSREFREELFSLFVISYSYSSMMYSVLIYLFEIFP